MRGAPRRTALSTVRQEHVLDGAVNEGVARRGGTIGAMYAAQVGVQRQNVANGRMLRRTTQTSVSLKSRRR